MRTLSFPLAATTCLVLAGAVPLSALAQDGDVTVVEGSETAPLVLSGFS